MIIKWDVLSLLVPSKGLIRQIISEMLQPDKIDIKELTQCQRRSDRGTTDEKWEWRVAGELLSCDLLAACTYIQCSCTLLCLHLNCSLQLAGTFIQCCCLLLQQHSPLLAPILQPACSYTSMYLPLLTQITQHLKENCTLAKTCPYTTKRRQTYVDFACTQ